MIQCLLFEPEPLKGPEPSNASTLTCAFNEPWLGPHPLCEAETARGCRAFDEGVARGEFDSQGFTKAERRAQQKRRAL